VYFIAVKYYHRCIWLF